MNIMMMMPYCSGLMCIFLIGVFRDLPCYICRRGPSRHTAASTQVAFVGGGKPETSGRTALPPSHALCLALDLTVSNVVHPSTVHRQHLRRNPT